MNEQLESTFQQGKKLLLLYQKQIFSCSSKIMFDGEGR